MTEACNSVGVQSWGYRREEDFYSIRHLTSSIDSVMARGGSYLLNVGPRGSGLISPEYESRIARVGDWYCRMDGALECHEDDPFEYELYAEAPIVTKKNNKSYFHFPNGLISSSIIFTKYQKMPTRVRLLNTNTTLNSKIEYLPAPFDKTIGLGSERLHITGIPTDELASEAIVIEIEW